MLTRKCLAKGCTLFLAIVIEVNNEKKERQSISVVCDFPELFLKDIPRFPPGRRVGFQIDLLPGTTLIAKTTYRLPPTEMKDHMM